MILILKPIRIFHFLNNLCRELLKKITDNEGYILQDKTLNWMKSIILNVLRNIKGKQCYSNRQCSPDSIEEGFGQLDIEDNKIYRLDINGSVYKVNMFYRRIYISITYNRYNRCIVHFHKFYFNIIVITII